MVPSVDPSRCYSLATDGRPILLARSTKNDVKVDSATALLHQAAAIAPECRLRS